MIWLLFFSSITVFGEPLGELVRSFHMDFVSRLPAKVKRDHEVENSGVRIREILMKDEKGDLHVKISLAKGMSPTVLSNMVADQLSQIKAQRLWIFRDSPVLNKRNCPLSIHRESIVGGEKILVKNIMTTEPRMESCRNGAKKFEGHRLLLKCDDKGVFLDFEIFIRRKNKSDQSFWKLEDVSC